MTDIATRHGLISILKAKYGKMRPSEKRRRARPARWLYPWTAEERYAAARRAWFRPVRDYIREYLKEHGAAIFRGDSDEAVVRNDETTGASFNLMIRSLNYWLGQYVSNDPTAFSASPIYMGLGNIADSVFNFNGRQYGNSARHSLGIEFPVNESWWPIARENCAQANYQVTSADFSRYVGEINRLTERAVTSGWSRSKLSSEIKKLDGNMTDARARFIARDQIGKLNGEITQRRMEAAGLETYVWGTANDERVRDSHVDLRGRLCKWADSTVYSLDGGRTWISRPPEWCQLHPGKDYQCRCSAYTNWNEVLSEVDPQTDWNQGYINNSAPPSTLARAAAGNIVLGFAKPSPLIEKQLGIRQEAPATVDAARDAANPDFGRVDGSEDNCQNSVIAYEMQRRGYRVEARPFQGEENAPITNAMSAFMARNADYRRADGIGNLKAQMLRSPVGSRFVVSHRLDNPNAARGHDYIAERTAGGIIFRDPQNSNKNAASLPGRAPMNDAREQHINFMRIDNKILDPRIDFSGVLRPASGARRVDNLEASVTMDNMDDTASGGDNVDYSDFVTSEQADALLGYDPFPSIPPKRIYDDGRPITVEEAREMLKNSEDLAPRERNGVIYHWMVGECFKESEDRFSFAVYWYSSKAPIDPAKAFCYFVFKDTSIPIRSVPMPLDEDILKNLKAP